MNAAAPAVEDFLEAPQEPYVHLDEGDHFGPWAHKQYLDKYSWKDEDQEPTEVWPDTAYRAVFHTLGALGYGPRDYEFERLVYFVASRKFIPGGRYLALAGRDFHMIQNCFMYRCLDSREGWADTVRKAVLALSSGGGIGVVYSDVRPNGERISKTGGVATGPLSPAQMVNEVARHVMAGGNRRGAIWGGLHWNHKDIFDWINIKDWSDEIKALKERDPKFPAPLDMTNISVILDDAFFAAYEDLYNPNHAWAKRVYRETVAHMVRHGEPGFSVNTGENNNEVLRNACTELSSEDDSDVCNIGSLNLARIEDKEELTEITRLAELFLIAGTVYSDVPHEEVRAVREKNRRTGLGMMGGHEWLLKRGYRYEMVPELREWMEIYERESDYAAEHYARLHNLSIPIKRRAVAPTGTIGILAETTTSWEPLMAVAVKRRFYDMNGDQRYQYVIDPVAARLIEEGIDPDSIETAYSLATDYERRIKMQWEIQRYIDHGIASTINLPEPMVDQDAVAVFAKVLMKYLPGLRGITCYPDGARGGQPLTEVPYAEALGKEGVTFDDDRSQACNSGVCGI